MNWNGIISLLFASIEFLLLLNLLIFIEKNRLNIAAMSMIALLAIYQSLEFIMCQIGITDQLFPYLALLDISFLPPLNLLLTLLLISKGKFARQYYLIFLPAIAFSVYYLFVITEFAVTGCTVLYASYHYPFGDLYGAFYYLPVLTSIILLIRFIPKAEDKKKKIIAKVLLFGSVFISLPVVLGFTLMFTGNYSIIIAMESIMCKFAIVYAVCLTFICLYNSPIKDERNYLKHLSGYK